MGKKPPEVDGFQINAPKQSASNPKQGENT
jgi:hypothetical protein